jgi:hypothetical protein
MKELIEDAQYALRNLETLKENIYADASYAKALCSKIDFYDGLSDKLSQAETGLECLIDYIKEIINKADPPKKFKAVMDYEGKHYTYELSVDEIARNYDDEDYCYWLVPLEKNDESGKWLEINMEMDVDCHGRWRKPLENGYAVVYSSYEEMMQAGDGEDNLPPVKFFRI